MAASAKNKLQLARYLVSRNVDLDARTSSGETSLSISLMSNHFKLASFLIKAGINVDTQNSKGMTPLMIAAMGRGYVPASQMISILSRDSLNKVSDFGKTALMSAAVGNNHETGLLLLKRGVSVNNLDKNNGSALIYASVSGNVALAKGIILTDTSALNQRDNRGYSSLMYASFFGLDKLQKMILSFNPDSSFTDKSRRENSLMLAAKNGHIKCIGQLLKKKDIDLSVTNKFGKTAKDLLHNYYTIRKKTMSKNERQIFEHLISKL